MKAVCIIHASPVVQNGLSEVLRKKFRCRVLVYAKVEDVPNKTKNVVILVDENQSVPAMWAPQNKPNQLFKISTNATTSNAIISILENEESIASKLESAIAADDSKDMDKEGLTAREIDVLRLVALGHSNKEMADKLCISAHTVMSHRKNITEKLGIKSISGLTVYAILNDHIDTTNLNIGDLI